MPASGRGKDLPDPEDLLSRKVQAGVRVLFEIIHRINPSSRKVVGESKSKAYATKAALQSLLIEDFAEELLIEATEEGENSLIGIRHRFLPLDACHAVVSQLSPRARSWVQRQLDLKKEESSLAESGKGEKAEMRRGLTKLLEKGDKALAKFDFLGAADSYKKVLRRSKSWKVADLYKEASKRFLILMVDHWGDDLQALAFVDEMPEELACEEDLCGLFAVSLARLGKIQSPNAGDALKWLRERRNGC